MSQKSALVDLDALRESEEKHRVTLESILSPTFITGDEGQFTFVCPNVFPVLGYSVEEMQAKGTIQAFLGKRLFELEDLNRLGRITNIKTVIASKGGEERDYSVNVRRVSIKDGTILYVCHDITDLTRAEQSLQESMERFRLAAEVTSDVIWEWDVLDGSLTTFGELDGKLEYAAGAFPRTMQAWRSVIHPDDQDRVMRAIQRHLEHKTPYFEEYRVVRKDDTIGYWEDRGRAVWNADGTARKMIGAVTDVTGRRNAEEERNKLQSQFLHAQKMESMGRLAGGVAHDFNNMLAIILGRLEFCLDRLDSADPLYDDLCEVQVAAQRSSDLTRRLLAFARKQVVAPAVLDLNETLTGMLSMLRRVIGEDIDLSWRPGESLWQVKVDPGQIDQILVNLCVNARDAISGTGRLTIETRNVSADEARADGMEGELVLLAVSDDGCGMDESVLSNLFEPFFTTKDRGTGLGLSTVYGIVSQNNGFIEVSSRAEEGTTVEIYLPRHIAEAAPVSADGLVAEGGACSGTILLVEDEPCLLTLYSAMLTKLGCTVLTADTPSKAIELVDTRHDPIDLLITDVVMPEMNGLELAKRLRLVRPNMKWMLMSGYPADEISDNEIASQDVLLLTKPFSQAELGSKIQQAMGSE